MIKQLLFGALFSSSLLMQAQTCATTSSTGAYATFYTILETTPSSVVKCSFPRDSVKGTFYGALDSDMFSGITGGAGTAGFCGTCVSMTGPAGTATVQIVDECPTCTHSTFDIDLSPQAFAAIVGDQSLGVKPVSWTEVSCPWATKPIYVVTEGSNQWYGKFIVGGHVNRINKVEAGRNGTYVNLTRDAGNGWSGSIGSLGGSIIDIRATDIYGEMVVVTGIDLSVDPTYSTTTGTSNFTACGVTSTAEINSYDYISAFPNPASDVITFEGLAGVTAVQLISATGEQIGSQVLGGTAEVVSVDISNLAAGIYVANMLTNDGVVQSVRFVKN